MPKIVTLTKKDHLTIKHLYLDKCLSPSAISAQLSIPLKKVSNLIYQNKWARIRKGNLAAADAKLSVKAARDVSQIVAEVSEVTEQVWREGLSASVKAARAAGQALDEGNAPNARDYSTAFRSLTGGTSAILAAWREASGLSVRQGSSPENHVSLSLNLLSLPIGNGGMRQKTYPDNFAAKKEPLTSEISQITDI